MDIGKALTYMLQDEKWAGKVLIGGLANLVPVANLAAIGYQIRVMRRVAAGAPAPLPEWHEFWTLLRQGLPVALAGLIYALPGLLLTASTVLLSVAGRAVATGGPEGQNLAAILLALALGATGLTVFYGLALSLWLPAATLHYAIEGRFAAFFRSREVWRRIAARPSEYIVALAVAWGAMLVAGLVGGMTAFVGAAFTGFWAMLVGSYLLGQLARSHAQATTTVER